MVSSYTTNKQIEKPANGDYNNTWSTPVNSDWDIIDKAFGGTTAINAVGASGTVTLTATQYQAPIVVITGSLTSNVNYQLPAGVGGFWYIFNNTSGAFSILFSSASGGSTATLPQGYTVGVISDGTNIGFSTTNAALINSTYADPAFITSLAASKLTGAVAVVNGGTGQTSYTDGQLLIGNSTGNTLAKTTLTAGSGITVTNGAGSITIAATAGGGGTVTSVNASTAISGLSFTGGPITGSGTLTLSGTLGVQGGGTGTTSLTSGAVLIGAGTSAVTSVSPSTAGNVLTSNGSAWVSQAPSGGGAVSSVTGSGSGISVSPTTGAVVVSNTGVTSIVAGTNVTISGATGAVTINAASASGTFSASDGTAASPSIFFTSDTNTGIFRPTTDTLGFTAGGAFSGAIAGSINGTLRLGYNAGLNSSATSNVFLGASAGQSATTGINNVCVGNATGTAFTVQSGNTLIGNGAGNATTGGSHTCIGAAAGSNITSGQNNIVIGGNAAASTATASNEITLGNASMTLFRCNVTTITSLSDARDKKDIEDLDAGLGFINALRPVQFTWDMRPTTGMDGEVIEGRKGDPDTGFLAQDLKAAQQATGITIPGLVYDSNPDKLEAGYGKLLPVLVKAIQELSAKVEALEAQLGGA